MENLNIYKLYKSKVKLSTLLQQQTISIQPSYYVLVVCSSNNSSSNEDKYLQSMWFNRWTGEINFKNLTFLDLEVLEEICSVYGFIGKFQISSGI